MKYIKLIVLILLISGNANAGFNALTYHSRANCMNNESISWDATHYWTLGTVTQHYKDGQWIHGESTGWQTTWRSAAVHWGEAKPGSGWEVKGYHWIIDARSHQQLLFGTTDVYDCSIYDGWWDKK